MTISDISGFGSTRIVPKPLSEDSRKLFQFRIFGPEIALHRSSRLEPEAPHAFAPPETRARRKPWCIGLGSRGVKGCKRRNSYREELACRARAAGKTGTRARWTGPRAG